MVGLPILYRKSWRKNIEFVKFAERRYFRINIWNMSISRKSKTYDIVYIELQTLLHNSFFLIIFCKYLKLYLFLTLRFCSRNMKFSMLIVERRDCFLLICFCIFPIFISYSISTPFSLELCITKLDNLKELLNYLCFAQKL